MKKTLLFDERFISFTALLVGVLIFVFSFKSTTAHQADTQDNASTESSVNLQLSEDSAPENYPHTIKRNTPLYSYLSNLGVPPLDIIEMVRAAKPKKNLSKLITGTKFQILQNNDKSLSQIKFKFSEIEKLKLTKKNGAWLAELIKEPVDVKPVTFLGKVESTLWGSAQSSNMDPYLIIALAEVFAWEVDFSREVRLGDKWRIIAEEKSVRGHHVGWGAILAAEYIKSGKSHKALLFRKEGEDVGYYNLKGGNLRKMFLKSPLRFGRITSRFNKRRFHPKLKRIRPHNGVDYGAPIGTPVRAVADGKVTFSKYRGGGGKTLKIRHNSTYKTAYKHLSRFARGVRPGKKVKQGQIVAYVGNTGLSTGPHLHYEFFVNNRFVDPLKQKFPSADPIAENLKPAFIAESQKIIAKLPPWAQKNFVLLASQGETPPNQKKHIYSEESHSLSVPLKIDL